MSAKVVAHPSAGPAARWPGHVPIDGTGARIALELLIELDSTEDGKCISDQASIDHWPREGKPYRNIVAEYAARAQSAEALAAFYSVLGDYLASAVGGCCRVVDDYERFCGEESPE